MKIFKIITIILVIFTFTNCSSSTGINDLPVSEQMFIHAMKEMKDLQGVIWMFREKRQINPDSYSEIKDFVKKYNLNYKDTFTKAELSNSGYGENDEIKFHFALNFNQENSGVGDSVTAEIEADAFFNFIAMESSIAMLYGRNLKGRINDRGKEEIFSADSTNVYLTRVTPEDYKQLTKAKN